MGKEDWERLRTAFDQLSDLTPAQRNVRLKQLQLPAHLADRLAVMLDAHDGSGVLDMALSTGAYSEVPVYASLASGTRVGGFRIDHLIGRGGSGEVYLAHRDDRDFEQRVALKMLRPELAQRFELFANERRTLAGLDHPGIAHLIDGGIADDGRPWTAMEYVEGVEIDRWCRDNRANVQQRLQLFLGICDAVSHAHARLVIHRDLKPGNILVDASGHARLLDFGIARLLDADNLDRAATQALLTPDYAAPEQFDGSAMTVATDIYGLGAVLFELLAGRGPWESENKSFPTLMRRLLHEDAPLPSDMAIDPAVPKQAIIGDLDAITAKAMRRDPAARYESVASLADDIRRHLIFKPVLARLGSAGYKARRFIRRHRLAATAASAVLAVFLLGVGGIWWQAHQAERERDSARSEAARLEAVNGAMMLMFRNGGDVAQFGSSTVSEMIDSTMDRLLAPGSEMAPDAAATVGALADLYLIAENDRDAYRLLERALSRGVGRNDAAGTARLKVRLGTIWAREKRFAEARRLLAEASAVWATDPVRYRRDIVETVGGQALLLWTTGKRDEAIALLDGNLTAAETAYFAHNRDLVARYMHLIRYLVVTEQYDKADAVAQRGHRVLAARDKRSAPALTLLRTQGGIALDAGRLSDAERLLRQTVDQRRSIQGRSLELAVDLLHHGRLLTRIGKPAEALKELDEARPMAVEFFGLRSRPVMLTDVARADALAMAGERTDAMALLARLEPDIRKSGVDSLDYANFLRIRAMAGSTCAADLAAANAILKANGKTLLSSPCRPELAQRRPAN